MLLAVLQRVPAQRVAATCDVSCRAVRRWASGERVPAMPERLALERFGIPAVRWSVTGNRDRR